MNHQSRLKNIVLLLLLGLIVSCVPLLPEYARPRFHVPEDGQSMNRDGFGYRQLTVEDFRAKSLPPDYSQFNHHISAHSCISIRPSQDSKARIILAYYHGHSFYVGNVPQLTFEAIFVPDCSWWNPEVPEGRKAYVLQHEQIHFTLAEVAARRLTREASDEMKGYLAIDNNYRAVKEELMEKMKSMARAALKSNIEEHTEFDEDTSQFQDSRAQQWWQDDVDARLAE